MNYDALPSSPFPPSSFTPPPPPTLSPTPPSSVAAAAPASQQESRTGHAAPPPGLVRGIHQRGHTLHVSHTHGRQGGEKALPRIARFREERSNVPIVAPKECADEGEDAVSKKEEVGSSPYSSWVWT